LTGLLLIVGHCHLLLLAVSGITRRAACCFSIAGQPAVQHANVARLAIISQPGIDLRLS
jgi:hypothetical protein